jgi:LAO/AO transport system kinase
MKKKDKDNKNNSALSVQKGIERPENINSESVKRFKKQKKTKKSSDEYFNEIINGNINFLSQAITLTESTLHEDKTISQEIINKCVSYSGKSIRIGFTGVPGVGKSSIIETLGLYLIEKGKKIAVLAIDPSGTRSKGSILGDKTRMEQLSIAKKAFIRPSPAAGFLGGVAAKTAESIILCEAAGFDVIFVETVGVGQSEIAVYSMTDFFLLLMLAGAGDELQGIKRGIMEMADAVVITKADGDNILKAKAAVTEYKNAIHLFPPSKSGNIIQVTTASAFSGDGIDELWKIIEEYIENTKNNGYFTQKRKEQLKFRMNETISEELKRRFYENPEIKKKLSELEAEVENGNISPYFAAKIILDEK